MNNSILGLHHITAIAGSAKRNLHFYTEVLGLRLVKKTVNFDDPGTYHFYFGNEVGSPGTILTFFPWEQARKGKTGAGMVSEIGYSVPQHSLGFWADRLKQFNITQEHIEARFGEQYLSFVDPDGLRINLVVSDKQDGRKPWETDAVKADVAIRGFHNATLMLKDHTATAAILTGILGYTLLKQEGSRYRFMTDAVEQAAIVDILELPDASPGINAAGTNHHVAFRVKDESVLMEYREKVLQQGLHITPKIDRDYFFSLYFREPGDVLFELATDNPGFDKDEPVNALGTGLKLPKQYEAARAEIEKGLPPIY